MIGKLKKKSIQKFYDITIVKKHHQHQPKNKVKKVAVLLDDETIENKVITNLINKFSLKKEDITILIYRAFDKKQAIATKFFTEKEFGFKASLKSDNLKDFVQKEYDLFINYTKTPNLYTNTITLLSQAGLKTGFAGIDDRLYDLIVVDKSLNEEVLNQEVKKYLTILNKT
ncbi:DUF6913 domain-containing protein [Tenacibaculum aestuariivivum]|uniref:DUF6913 domain-containing protein n=1 Tax=Tenacibaculum aestuariivivum TaxID=2006131 RepID=UPI003AB74112